MSDVFKALTAGLVISEYDGWKIFVERLNQAVQTGNVRKISVVKLVYSQGEEWFLDPESNQIYVYVEPNDYGPIWQKLDVLTHLGEKTRTPLSMITTRKMSPMTAHVTKLMIENLISRGQAEELPCPAVQSVRKDETERRFRDLESNIVYRLTEFYGLHDPDYIRWEVVPQSELNQKIQ